MLQRDFSPAMPHPQHDVQSRSHSASVERAEEVESNSRPRLTHDQISELEREFAKKQKPSTEYKNNLADKMGVTRERINVGLTFSVLMIVRSLLLELVPESSGQREAPKAQRSSLRRGAYDRACE